MSTASNDTDDRSYLKGPLAWMAQNSVASNLLMGILLVGGFLMIGSIKQEVFPNVTLDAVTISLVYPGASPSEVEQGAVLAVEEGIRGVEGIKEVRSTVREGGATITAELLLSADPDTALNDIKSEVDRITSFPEDLEEPNVALASQRRSVISVIISGETDEKTLREMAERVRNDLLDKPDITLVQLEGVRDPEISIEIPQENLRQYNLTLQQVAQAVGAASVELPGGGVKTPKGEVLLRVDERRETAEGFEQIVILSQPDGTQVTVGDLGTVTDGFEDVDSDAYFNGKSAVRVTVFRVGDQTPIELADIVKTYVDERREDLPPGIEFDVWNDQSEIYRDRIDLLLRNAFMGLILVLLLLGVFLEIRLAFWVTLGIPISFLGAMLFMPFIGVSLNMISLFAFILTLGIVVDDAIVVGEAVYTQRQAGHGVLKAAILGVREVAQPVIFSVLTTVIAFSPLLFVPGVSGKFFVNIPMIVIPILLLSLVESLLVLPAHLAHGKPPSQRGFLGAVHRAQGWFARQLERFVEQIYQPFIHAALDQRYLTLAVAISMLIMSLGIMGGGLVKFNFLPTVEGETINASVTMPYGTAADDTRTVMRRMERTAMETFEELGGQEQLSRGVFALMGMAGGGGGPGGAAPTTGSHVAQVNVFLVPAGTREVSTEQFAKLWREKMGEVPGAENLQFAYDIGPGSDAAINIQLSHPDIEVLEVNAETLAAKLGEFGGVKDIDDGFALGKEQLDLKLRPEARTLGITQRDLAQQVRGAFFGAEAARQQRGRDELRVYVRYPEGDRQTEFGIETLVIRTPNGGELPLEQAAVVSRGRAYNEITRIDGRRVVSVTADVDLDVVTPDEVLRPLKAEYLPRLSADTPGLKWSLGGQQNAQAESFGALGQGFAFALLIMFTLMAVAFRSYVQPVIVMAAIPFGFVGAILGHLLMGYALSFISIMGIVALSGVVVNDSLVLVDAINNYRAQGMGLKEAVVTGGMRRFRPILLTTLTTFFGLAPMLAETSPQARFLIPMAISLGCGILFVTFIALVLVPTLYLILEDVGRGARFVQGLYVEPQDPSDPNTIEDA